MASLPHVSVAGAIATGTHGSGDRLGNLASAVALDIVCATGDLDGSRSLGADLAHVSAAGRRAKTARASLLAGVVHVLSTLLVALAVWLAGVVVTARFGQVVETASSIALMAFGAWIAVAAWREMRGRGGHGRSHTHQVTPITTNDIHGPEHQTIATDLGELVLSIYEAGVPPRFRLTGIAANAVRVETLRVGRQRQVFLFANHETYWESVEEILEPHEFDVVVALKYGGEAYVFETRFAEHDHVHGGHTHDHGPDPARDPLYAPLCGDTTLLTPRPYPSAWSGCAAYPLA